NSALGTIKLLKGHRERIERGVIRRRNSPGELIPVSCEGKDDHRRQRRSGQRERNRPEGAKNTTTVDSCRVEEFLGNFLEEASQQINPERHPRRINQDQAQPIVSETQ